MESIVEPDYDLLFNPRSIAFIGASNHIEKWGGIVLLNIILGGYRGRIYPVNPKEETIFGIKAYPRASQIPDPVDLAIIAIPASLALEAVEDCLKKGIRMAIVITSDFSETGAEGAALEREMVQKAKAGSLRLVGPNTMGIFSASASLVALMPAVRPKKGGVSLVSQSGNIGAQMLGRGEGYGVKFNKFVSSGNEGDLRTEDYLSFFGRDAETQVILSYMEGLDDGRRFVETARGITPRKPIIALKGGKTSAGARAAKSHSGAMAGSRELYEAAFRQTGIIWADTSEEMLEWAAAFSSLPLPRGNRVGILTRGGGWGVITADACQQLGLEVPPLEEPLIRSLGQILPVYWSKGNPIDLVATTSIGSYAECLQKLISWEKVDMVISLSSDTGPFSRLLRDLQQSGQDIVPCEDLERLVRLLSAGSVQFHQQLKELMEKYQKPILAVAATLVQEGRSNDFPLPQFDTPERAAKAAGALYQYARFRRSIGQI